MNKEERRYWAKVHNFGGYNRNAGISKKEYREDSFGTPVCLQSSFESRCALILDELKINWIRPKCLYYIKLGERKRYFPDFLLVDFNIYLDPKNDYLAKLDTEKIQLVSKHNNVRIDILTESLITQEHIGSIVKLV